MFMAACQLLNRRHPSACMHAHMLAEGVRLQWLYIRLHAVV